MPRRSRLGRRRNRLRRRCSSRFRDGGASGRCLSLVKFRLVSWSRLSRRFSMLWGGGVRFRVAGREAKKLKKENLGRTAAAGLTQGSPPKEKKGLCGGAARTANDWPRRWTHAAKALSLSPVLSTLLSEMTQRAAARYVVSSPNCWPAFCFRPTAKLQKATVPNCLLVRMMNACQGGKGSCTPFWRINFTLFTHSFWSQQSGRIQDGRRADASKRRRRSGMNTTLAGPTAGNDSLFPGESQAPALLRRAAAH